MNASSALILRSPPKARKRASIARPKGRLARLRELWTGVNALNDALWRASRRVGAASCVETRPCGPLLSMRPVETEQSRCLNLAWIL